MKRSQLAVLALAVAAGLALFFWRRSANAPSPPPPVNPAKQADSKPPPDKPKAADHPKGEPGGPPPELAVSFDDDPVGGLRLEGQVVDSDDRPVAGARVFLSSNPRRQVKSELDGSFAFDKLVGRTYSVQAAKEDAIADATVRLTAKTEPVILHLKTAGGLEVTVVAVDDRKPIAGAEVELRDEPVAGGSTNAEGKVTLRGVDAGWHSVEVAAPGYATSSTFIESGGRPGTLDKQTIELRHGAAASGKVVDPAGKPVAGAQVRAIAASSFGFGRMSDAKKSIVSDAAGRWTVPALPAGTFRFNATHEKHGPGSSPPTSLDGKSEHKDITITLTEGAHIAGQVVRKGGGPVASATVRVAVKDAGLTTELARQVFTNEKGAFDVTGLPRKPVELVASGETASSEIVPLDLAAKPEQLGLRIELDIDGSIAGLVVDAKGQAIAGAQVMATPEMGGKRDSFTTWRLRGVAQDLSDSGGHFEIHGLPDGSYRIRAARTETDASTLWQRRSVAASVGDHDVRLVVEDNGKVRGKVLFADGTAPKSFQVATGFGRGAGFSSADGAFEVEAPAGPATLLVSGPEFMQKTVSDVTVKADDATDVGTITVERGRSISGRVLRGDGTPVAGAKVLGGAQLIGSGSELSSGGLFGSMGGSKSTTSGDDGGYILAGVGQKTLVVAADTETEGRSTFSRVPAGTESVQLDLTLQPLGALEGKVTSDGKPLAGTMITAAPQQASRGTFMVKSDDSGSYRFDKLAPDNYIVSSLAIKGMGSASLHSQMVQVQSDQVAHLDIDVPGGAVQVTVTIVSPPGANVHAAQVMLVTGTVASGTAEQLTEAVAARGAGALHSGFMMKDQPVVLEKIDAGSYSACAIPIPGDLNDPAAMMRIQGKLDKLISVCLPVQIAATPAAQSVTIKVPAPPPVD